MEQKTYEAEFLNKFIDEFKDVESMPNEDKNELCTYYCDNGDKEKGFVENTKFYDMGYTCFIAKKYIRQDKLNKLIEDKS